MLVKNTNFGNDKFVNNKQDFSRNTSAKPFTTTLTELMAVIDK